MAIDIELEAGTTETRTLRAKNGDGTARNITGKRMRIHWRPTSGGGDGGDSELTVTDATNGVMTFAFDANAMGLRGGTTYDVRITEDNNGSVVRLGAEGGAHLTMRVSQRV